MTPRHWRLLLDVKQVVPPLSGIASGRLAQALGADLWTSLLALIVTWVVVRVILGEVMHAYASRGEGRKPNP
jgi:hypothetical protein